jgi:hypothetical protein
MKRHLGAILHASLLLAVMLIGIVFIASVCGMTGGMWKQFGEWQAGAEVQSCAFVCRVNPMMLHGSFDFVPMASKLAMALWPRSGTHYQSDAVSVPLWMPLLAFVSLLVHVHRRVRRETPTLKRSMKWLSIRRLSVASFVLVVMVTMLSWLGIGMGLQKWASHHVYSVGLSDNAVLAVITPLPPPAVGGTPLATPTSLALVPQFGKHHGSHAASMPVWCLAAGVAGLYAYARKRSRALGPSQCPGCGYELAGLGKGAVCPECGKRAAEAAV